MSFDLEAHIERQRWFSRYTFGPGARTDGILDHLAKEMLEITDAPNDLEEWIDVIILGIDGAWRAGYSPKQIATALAAKQIVNEGRKWPDWRASDTEKAIEHERS